MTPPLLHALAIWEWRLAVLLIYAIPLHEGSKNALWFALVLVAATRAWLGRRWSDGGRCGGLLALWVACGAWSSLLAIEPAASWKGVWDMVRGAALFWVALDLCRDAGRRERILRHIACAGAVAGAVGLWDWLLAFRHFDPSAPRIALGVRSVGHYNQSGLFLAISWAVAIAFAAAGRFGFRSRAAGIAVCAFTGAAMLATTARAATAVGVLVSALILWRTRPARWVAWLYGAGLAAALLAVVASPFVRQRLFFQGSYGNRVATWEAAVRAARERPWTGVGLNNFKNIVLNPGGEPRLGTIDHAHNQYLNALAQGGAPGFAALLLLLGGTGAALWRLRPGPGGARGDVGFRAGAGAWLVVVLAGFSNTPIHHETAMLFFLVLGAALSAPRPEGERLRYT